MQQAERQFRSEDVLRKVREGDAAQDERRFRSDDVLQKVKEGDMAQEERRFRSSEVLRKIREDTRNREASSGAKLRASGLILLAHFFF